MAVSKGNNKLGKIPNISLPPIKSCGNCKECAVTCYALKAYKQYPLVRKSWDDNYNLFQSNHGAYFDMIQDFLDKKRRAPLTMFRWHVSGDIPNGDYFHSMVSIARIYPEIKFLVFTKMYTLINDYIDNPTGSDIPKNLVVIFSGWPGLAMDNPHALPVAYMQDGTEDRVPENALQCPGNCETCMLCWQLPFLNTNSVVFDIH